MKYRAKVRTKSQSENTGFTDGLQKEALFQLLKQLTQDYPEARIVGHCELPRVAKDCPCFPASKQYAMLQPENRHHSLTD